MAIIRKHSNEPIVKVSVSDSASTSGDESLEYENEKEMQTDNDADSDSSSKDGTILMTNEGWADSVTKILSFNKPKHKKTLVLSRAKKHTDTIKKEKEIKLEFEVIGEVKDEKPTVKNEDIVTEPPVKKKKIDKTSIRVKPNILEKDRERLLAKIATKGVVQLFNAVRNQQRSIEKEMDRNDLSESKKEKILKKFDKRTFLDTLMGQTKSVVVDEESKVLKNELKAEDEKPRWSALRDDFMMGAKMKDWDKESIDE